MEKREMYRRRKENGGKDKKGGYKSGKERERNIKRNKPG
jgi:hypothetical protein